MWRTTRFVEWHDCLMNPLELPIMVRYEIIPFTSASGQLQHRTASIFKHYHDSDLHLSRILPEPLAVPVTAEIQRPSDTEGSAW